MLKKLLWSLAIMATATTIEAANIHFTYPGWKYKALTFSYDDGALDDRKLVEIFNRYNMKATFNVSAGRAGTKDYFLKLDEYAELYKGHEIASHGFKHLNMCKLSDEELEKEIREDLISLEKVAGYPIRGFAYPYGAYDDRVEKVLAKYGIIYARTVEPAGKRLVPPFNPLEFHPQTHHRGDLPLLAEKYRNYKGWGGVLTMCTVWGHSYEFGRQNNWEVIENFCREMANLPDIWYATNGEIFSYLEACRQVRMTLDGEHLINPTATTIYYWCNGKFETLPPTSVKELEVAPAPDLPAGRYMLFPGGKRQALTLSYDDGNDMASDAKLIGIFNKNHLKGTFNVNAMRDIDYSIYDGHEVATHGYSHALFRTIPFDRIVSDIYRDRAIIESHVKYPVRGHAYPNGNAAISPESITVLKGCGIVYARGTDVRLSGDFSLPADEDEWLMWRQTAHHSEVDLMALGKEFKTRKDAPLLCAVWGHSWEFARKNNWETIEQFAELMADDPDIWYATNIEIYDYWQAVEHLQWSTDGSFVHNPSAQPVYYAVDGKAIVIPSGKTVFINAGN